MKALAAVLALVAALALGGCAAADKNAVGDSSGGSSGNSQSASGANAADSGAAAKAKGAGAVVGAGQSGSGSGMSSMPGMDMSGSSATSKSGAQTGTVVSPSGVPTPVPIRTIASGDWKQMQIQAQTMTPIPFYIYNGNSYTEVKPTKADSFHLMVMLTDKETNAAIPYASVWATITKNGKPVYDKQQWPMLSEYMGPHYGDDVALPGPGTYKLTLLVSAPEAGLHVEYAHMWQGKHRLSATFTWQ